MYALKGDPLRVNSDKPDRWKEDIRKSIDFYNSWFISSAPVTFRNARKKAIERVQKVMRLTNEMKDFSPTFLLENPDTLPVLRMVTAPPIARDRLIGLSGVKKYLVNKLEKEKAVPKSYDSKELLKELESVLAVIHKLLDEDLFVWLAENRVPKEEELFRAETVIADRLTGAISDPIIRNTQEQRQLATIGDFLTDLGYREVTKAERNNWRNIPQGTFAFRINIPIVRQGSRSVNIPVDVVIQPKNGNQPLLVEAKSAGDFTNTNKRRKEEAQKVNQLRQMYGKVQYILFLCGYFDSGYLGYEAAEGIDWVWEHRISDLEDFGL